MSESVPSPGAAAPLPYSAAAVALRLAAENPDWVPAYYLLAMGDEGEPVVTRYDTVEELGAAIQAADGSHTAIVPLLGYRLWVTKPPLRHLEHTGGMLPLFNTAQAFEREEDGFLGVRDTLQAPQAMDAEAILELPAEPEAPDDSTDEEEPAPTPFGDVSELPPSSELD